jgi:hypothetical protein
MKKSYGFLLAGTVFASVLMSVPQAHARNVCAEGQMYCPSTGRCEDTITITICGGTTTIPKNCPFDPDLADEHWHYTSSGPHATCAVSAEHGGFSASCNYTDTNQPRLTPDANGEAWCVIASKTPPDTDKDHCGYSAAAYQCLQDHGIH